MWISTTKLSTLGTFMAWIHGCGPKKYRFRRFSHCTVSVSEAAVFLSPCICYSCLCHCWVSTVTVFAVCFRMTLNDHLHSEYIIALRVMQTFNNNWCSSLDCDQSHKVFTPRVSCSCAASDVRGI